jgi:hypothetical protein
MPDPIASIVELELSAGVWTDVSADVLDGITVDYGIRGGGPTDRCASTGMLRLSLDNSALNSGQVVGFYAPGHASCRAGFDVGIGIRWRTATPVARTLHRGRIISIDVVPGVAQTRRTRVESVDWMDEAATVNVSGITTQVGQRADQVLTEVLTGITQQPVATAFSTGDSTFGYALDNVQDEATRLLTVFADLVNSEGSFLYLTGGGTLTFESRTDRALVVTPAITLTNDMMGLTVGRTRDDVVNVVLLTIHPRRIDAAATTVLWSRNIADGEAPIEIAAGVTLPVLLGAYGDPNNGRQRCGGTAMVTPVATTDYLMNTAADGTGTNITADLAVTAALGGNGVAWTLENNNAATGYVTKLQCRGKGIYDRAPVVVRCEDATSIALYGERTIRIDMPYQDDENAAAAFGEQILNLYTATGSVPRAVQLRLASTDALLDEALGVEVGDRVDLVETVTGLAASCFVNGVQVTARQGLLDFSWTVAPCDANPYWLLGVTDFGELGDVTYLGYG